MTATAPQSDRDVPDIIPISIPNGAADTDATMPRDAFWPQIDAAAYYGLPGEVVETFAPHSEADRVALLLEFLVQFGNAVGRGPHYQIGGSRHHLNLYLLLVGETSLARKGTAHDQVAQIMIPTEPEWQTNCTSTGLSSGEGLVYRVRDAAGEDPGVSDKRLLVVEEEFGSVIAVMQRRGSTLPAVLRAGWDGKNLGTMTRRNALAATAAHISIIGHITIEEARHKLDRMAMLTGFGSRFLYALVRRSQMLPFGGAPDRKIFGALAERVYRALDQAQQTRALNFAPAAAAQWTIDYANLSAAQPGLLGAVLARSAPQALRLASLYAVADRQAAIDLPHLLAALAVARYTGQSARHIFGVVTGDKIADRIITELRRQPQTRTQLSHLFAHHGTIDDLNRALELLSRLGLAECRRQSTGGRPVETWSAVL